MKTLLSLGHGYTAQALVKILPDDWRIIATTRSVDKMQRLRQTKVEVLIWPDADLNAVIEQADHLLSSIAPTAQGDPILAQYANPIAQSHFDWVGYLSTTGIYGDHGGAWVDETTPPNPMTQRGQWRMKAEQAWASLGLPLHIFRLAGIYGPGRGPFAKLRAGKARRIIKPNQVFSRIHVEDIAQVLLASINQPNAGAIYNLCDDNPAPPQDVVEYGAKLLGLPIPKAEDFQTAEQTPMARSFYSESKRVKNDRIKSELGVKLHYPDYQSGLRSLLTLDE